MATGKLKRWALIVALNVALLTPLIYGFELYLEKSDPRNKLPPNGVFNGQRVTWGNVVKNNSFGFREREFQTPKPKGTFRIMVLGDSLTWGAGLAPEQRYSALLENSLRKAYPEKNFEVLNFGFEAAATTEERDLLKRIKAQVQPDMIIVGFCVNDPQPRVENYSTEREAFEAKYRRAFTSLTYRTRQLHLTALGQLIIDDIHTFAEKTNKIPTTDKALARVYVETTPEWQDFVQALAQIKQMSDEMHLPTPILAVLNQSASIGDNYNHPNEFLATILKLSRQAEAAAKQIGFRTLDYEKEIPVELATDSTMVNPLDGHPSAKLNQLYAKKLFLEVVDDLSLDSGRARSR